MKRKGKSEVIAGQPGVKQKESGSVKRQRTKKVFEGYTEVKAGLNATVDPSLRTVSDAAFSTTVRQSLMNLFPHIAAVLEENLSEDTSNASHVDSRTAIRSALSTPRTFFHIILYQIVPHYTQFASHFASSSQFIGTMYSDFHIFIRERRRLSLDSFVYIFNAMEHTARLKAQLREIGPKIMRSGIFNSHGNPRIHIHRLTAFQTLADVQESPAYGKIPVLRTPHDRLDLDRFPSNEYYHLPTSSETTIRPFSLEPEMHVIVSANAPNSDVVVKLVREYRRRNEDITRESWVEAVQFYNVFTPFPNDWLEDMNTKMAENIKRRSIIKRGELRDNKGHGVMVGTGDVKDQHGNVGSYRNMGSLSSDTVKYKIEESASEVLDICIEIAGTLFPSLVTFWRLNGIESNAIPNSLRRMVIAGFGTQKYAGPFHPDSDDTMFTLGFRFLRGASEPITAYQFCVVNRQLEGSTLPGIVIQQPSGSLGAWRGKPLLHASSCDVTLQRPKDALGSIGLVFSQKLSLLKQTEKYGMNTMSLADMKAMWLEELARVKMSGQDWADLKECYTEVKRGEETELEVSSKNRLDGD